MKQNSLKLFVPAILLPVGVGALAGILTKSAMPAYELLRKPPLTPPSIVFPIVWTILFVLMGVSVALILQADVPDKRRALTLYAVQLAVNFFWSILFFNLQAHGLALAWLVLLWALIVAMICAYWPISRLAALLQLPYLLWVTFAGYLNLFIWLLNR